MYYIRTNKQLIPIFTLILFSLINWVCKTLEPIPRDLRSSVLIEPLRDLTEQYNNVNPKFEELGRMVLENDFVMSEGSGYYEREFSVYQNPFKPFDSASIAGPTYITTGYVERIAYEPVENIKSTIVNYALFGLLGLALTSFDNMAMYLQYRFYVFENNYTVLDSFLVIGVAAGNPTTTSRVVLTEKASRSAACHFHMQLFATLMKHGIIVSEESRRADINKWQDCFRTLR